jgi:eukaryotic-like serine/threonine-protein kinase
MFDLLRGGPILRPEELRALEALRGRVRSPSELLRVVLKRGWLTAYQAQELFAGRGPELLLGEFVVLEKLGEGSTSRVFKARNQSTGQVVALKVLRQEGTVDRLHREFWAGSRLAHPNILQTHGSGQVGETHFLIVEYAPGRTLAQLLLDQGPLPVGRACDYARQASLGLSHALERGLVHRDVKPSNLLLMAGTGQVKVLDLGIACLEGARVMAAGTPDYVAPEQVFDPGRADTRSDVYALGCTLYHLLTGAPPFPGGSQEEKLLRHRHEEPRPVERLRPELSGELGGVIRTMMSKSPDQRLSAPAAVASALAPFSEPGDCDSHFVMELGEGGLEHLDPGQATDIL